MQNPQILVIESEPNQQETLSFMAEQNGFDAHVVESCKEGIGAFLTNPASLVLIDSKLLAQEEGRECVAELRKIEEQRGWHTPIIVLGSKNEEQTLPVHTTVDDFLVKPYTAEDFERVVIERARGQKVQKSS
jgi:DNA-binding response OmpR family regulator